MQELYQVFMVNIGEESHHVSGWGWRNKVISLKYSIVSIIGRVFPLGNHFTRV